MEKNRKVTFKNGIYTVFGKDIGMKDGMYCLSDLLDVLDENGIKRQEWSIFARSKSFLNRFQGVSGIGLESGYIVSKLYDIGHYKRIGKGNGCKIYISHDVFIVTLMAYTSELSTALAEFIIGNIKNLHLPETIYR